MKILITADWHLGKRLHLEDFSQDMEQFLQWLLQHIEENEIDLLLVMFLTRTTHPTRPHNNTTTF